MNVNARRQDAVDSLLGVLNDIGGGRPNNYNVSVEDATAALDATGILAQLERTDPPDDLGRIVDLVADLQFYRSVSRDHGLAHAAWRELRGAVAKLPESEPGK